MDATGWYRRTFIARDDSASRMVFGGGVLVGTYKRRLEKINRKLNLWDPVCNKDSY